MRFGLGSYACAWSIGAPSYLPDDPLDAFGFLKLAAELDFSLVQIADNLPLHDMSEAGLRSLKTLAADLGISVEVGTRGITDRHLERYLELAHFFGSPLLRVVVDTPGHEPSPGEVVTTLARVLPMFKAEGIKLALENHDRFGVATLVEILRQLDSPFVGICLDTVNSFGALEGPEVVVETLEPYVFNLHLKDFTVTRAAHNMGFTITGTPLGEGMLALDWLLPKFQHRPDLNAILEHWPAPEASLEKTIAKERLWLTRSTETIKQLRALYG